MPGIWLDFNRLSEEYRSRRRFEVGPSADCQEDAIVVVGVS